MSGSSRLSYVHKANDLPAYSPTEAARILRIPVTTVRAWIRGQTYRTKSGERLFRRVVVPADRETGFLSFTNLIELMILDGFRKRFDVPLRSIRLAIESARERFATEHPLADLRLLTDKKDIFVEQLGEYLNLSGEDQLEMKIIVDRCLLKVEKDAAGIPKKIFPDRKEAHIEIDPLINFGRPTIATIGIATEYIYERFRSGEDQSLLAADYRCDRAVIQSAIDFEEASRARAA